MSRLSPQPRTRRCRSCNEPMDLAEPHCPNAQCPWHEACVRRKENESRERAKGLEGT